MTEIDLRLQYKREFGEYPPCSGDHWILNDNDRWVLQSETQHYIDWLESELLKLKNK
jgi:hypothetical protein